MAIVNQIDAISGTTVTSRNIKEALDKLAATGEATKNIEDAMKQVKAAKVNPLNKLIVDTAIAADTDLLGKTIANLQKNVVITDNKIEGYLKYVTGYTGFSGDTEEQSGNYVAFHCSVPNEEDVTISVKTSTMTVTLDEDGIMVLRVKNKGVIEITASKTGLDSVTKKYDLKELVLEAAPAA